MTQKQEEYQKAILLAIRQGLIKSYSEVSEELSGEESYSLVLRGHQGEVLAKVSLIALNNVKSDGVPTAFDTNQDKAVAWAYTMGYDIPTKMDGCSQGCLIGIGCVIFILPGLLLIAWLMVKNNQYERDMAALVSKWIDAGRPEPGEGIKEETKLVRIEESTETSTVPVSTEARLQELITMKEKGLISDDEYDTLRKKALGL